MTVTLQRLLGRIRRSRILILCLSRVVVRPQIPPILLPVQLTLVPEKVATFNDVTVVLRHTVQVGGCGRRTYLQLLLHPDLALVLNVDLNPLRIASGREPVCRIATPNTKP